MVLLHLGRQIGMCVQMKLANKTASKILHFSAKQVDRMLTWEFWSLSDFALKDTGGV